MAIDRAPALKRCRSLGLEPGIIGLSKKSKVQPKRTNKKPSEYGIQLREKQKAKFIYGILERPFKRYYEKAKKMQGVTGENLLNLLERRIDNVVFRLGLASTRRQARQLVTHGHILVNGRRLDIPSAIVKAGDVVGIREKSRTSEYFKAIAELTGPASVPAWLTYNKDTMTGKVDRLPARAEIDAPIAEHLIVELYSK
ncbi:MAG: 30S ribosomal protein S4 [Acidaminococcales bacterium]|jgi:small subunit ribosomal protein S4|nr:30S ribosomal protein S4 [Acidaminococcales bacterium]